MDHPSRERHGAGRRFRPQLPEIRAVPDNQETHVVPFRGNEPERLKENIEAFILRDPSDVEQAWFSHPWRNGS